MPQKKILLDTCSYLRLAYNIKPLLGIEFGKAKYCLYVVPEFNEEYKANNRLKTKFHWASQPEYELNRKGKLFLSKGQKELKETTVKFIAKFASENALGVSLTDIKALSTAYVLGIQLVTDDKDMRKVAREYGIRVLKSLSLLSLMLKSGFIEMQDVKGTVEYWRYNKDLPGGFKEDFKKYFSKSK